jgi:predicted helicase
MLKRLSDQVLNETCSEEDAKACESLAQNLLRGTPPLEFLDSMLDKVRDNLRIRNEIIASITAKENNMPLAPNTINRILENITQETSELSLNDYTEVLEELQDEVETRLDAAKIDKEKADQEVFDEEVAAEVAADENAEEYRAIVDAEERQELEAKRELDGSEGE